MSSTRRGPSLRHAVGLATVYAVVPAASVAQSQQENRGTPQRSTVGVVQIRRENVFDRSESDRWIARAANGLHVVTREQVVAREVLVREGEPFDSARADETARNLRKLGIFHKVSVDTIRTGPELVARVTTHDSWTTQIYTSFKAGGDQITWGIGLTEKNLLGSHIGATVRYTSDPDRSTMKFGMSLPRVWRNHLGVVAAYDEFSDGMHARFIASKPFASLSARTSASLDLQHDDRSVLQFFEGQADARDTLRHLLTKATTGVGWAPRASPTGFVRLHSTLQLRREDFTSSPVAPDDRSFFGELELSVEASRSKFAVIRGYAGLGGPEDIDLSPTVRVGLWLAPSAWGYERTGVGPALSAHAGRSFHKGFARISARASSLFNREGLDSGSVTSGVVLALQPAARHSVVLNADVGWLKNPRPGDEFDLGLTSGPRGFPAHAFTGDRAFFTTAEYRWVAAPDVFGLVAIGLAAFADYGGAWYSGSPRRTGTDVGIGLRFGSTRSTSGKGATRVDFARRFANDVLDGKWVIAVGTGFAFDQLR